jgi:hypothetical protein
MNNIISYIILITLFAGCERYDDVEVDVPYKPKIVTSTFLRAQTTLVQVAVTRSLPVFNAEQTSGMESSPEYIKDATVMLQKGSETFFLTYDPDQQIYLFDLPSPIQAGERYELTVTSKNETSKGSTTIPGKVNIQAQLAFDSILQEDGSYQYLATLSFTLHDKGKHYLDFVPVLVYNDSSSNIDMMYTQGFGTITELTQGETATKVFVSSINAIGMSPQRLDLYVANCDEPYSRNANRSVDLIGGVGLIPFLDPVTTYSNMSGGIGIMGSFNMETKYTFNLK